MSIGTKKKKYVLCKLEKDRGTKYHSFLGLSNLFKNLWFARAEHYSYYISVEAEYRQGQIIALSPCKEVQLSRIRNDYNENFYDYYDE